MCNLFVLCGLPGSGKNFWIEKNRTDFENSIIVEPDRLRFLIGGDEKNMKNEKVVWSTAYRMVREGLQNRRTIYFSATSRRRKDRKKLIDIALEYNAFVEVVWIKTPLWLTIIRNYSRKRKVPLKIIWKFFKTFEPPTYDEKFNSLKVIK